MVQTVYFIQNLSTGNIKIGKSKNPSYRLKELQTGNDGKLVLMATVSEKYYTEEHLHLLFHHFRLNGEWFKYNEQLQSFIKKN